MTGTLDRSHRQIVLLLVVIPTVLLVLGVYAGLLQSLYRAGFITTASFLGIEYYQGLTLHGVVNALVYTTFFEVAFGYVVFAYYLECEFRAIVSWLAFGLMATGTLLAAGAMLTGEASVLYTFYPPLRAHPAFYVGAAMLVVGSWLPFLQWIRAYRRWREAHPGRRTPLAVVGMLATFTIWLIATLPLAWEVVVMLIPWSLGWTAGIDVVLARTLFWFFGHPLVYFWLLPAYVMFYVCLPALVGGKLYSDAAARLTFFLFIVLSAPVGLHHQFADPGIDRSYKWMHGLLTFMVALPSFLTAFTVTASLESGARRRGGTGLIAWWRRLPYFDRERYLFAYFIAGLVLFFFGGITGIINASMGMNAVVHNTAWVPGHFHTTVAGPVLLAFLGMSLFLVTGLTGRPVRLARLNVCVPYLWMVGVFVFSSGLSVAGILGSPRRSNLGPTYANPESPLYRPDWEIWSLLGAAGGVIMFVAMLAFFAVFFSSLLGPKVREPSLQLPTAEAYHDAELSAVRNFAPWVVAAVLLLGVAYVPPIYQVVQNRVQGAPAYDPASPVPKGS